MYVFQLARITGSLLVCLLVVCCAGCQDPVADGASDNKTADELQAGLSPKSPSFSGAKLVQWTSEYQEITEVLELDQDEQEKLASAFETHLTKLKKWNDENSAVIRDIRRKAIDAARNKDLRKLKQMEADGDKAKVAELTNEGRKLEQEFRVAVFEAIPADKRSRWQSHVIAGQLIEFLGPLKLTPQQTQQIHSLAPKAISQLQSSENWKGYGTSKLESLFEQQVVSDQQKSDFETLKQKNKTRMLRWSSH